MAGPDAPELLLQLNYTQPEAYPIIWQSASALGVDVIKGGTTYKVDVTFTIPANAKNGDTDDDGNPWPIML